MFKFFKSNPKSCKNCLYCITHITPAKLLDNKTVQKEKVHGYSCNRGDFELKDFEPCKLYNKNHFSPITTIKILPPPTKGSK